MQAEIQNSTAMLTQETGLERLAYRIGGISFSLQSRQELHLELDRELQQFAIDDCECDVQLDIELAGELSYPSATPLFHSGGLWSLFSEPQGYRFSFLRAYEGEGPYKEAWFDRDFNHGRILLSQQFFSQDRAVYPLEYPLDELLMIHRLARGEGVEMHAVGIVDRDGLGRLFIGHSGAGKSTTARLWQSTPGVHVLSDDRIILRLHHGRIWMYGTPWHGDAGISSPDCAQLHEIYFLEHAPQNSVISLRPTVAAAELFARCFVPRHCAQALDFTLNFLAQLAQQIPCHQLQFVPDRSAVEAIRRGRN